MLIIIHNNRSRILSTVWSSKIQITILDDWIDTHVKLAIMKASCKISQPKGRRILWVFGSNRRVRHGVS